MLDERDKWLEKMRGDGRDGDMRRKETELKATPQRRVNVCYDDQTSDSNLTV